MPLTPIVHADLDPQTALADVVFDHTTTQSFGETEDGTTKTWNIGWLKMMYCNEAHNNDAAKFRFIGGNNEDDTSRFVELAPYAISVKIVPDGLSEDAYWFPYLAVTAKPCRNPIIALNNNIELSYQINVNTLQRTGYQNIDNWYATWDDDSPKSRLTNSCYGTSQPLTTDIYHACGNIHGIHIQSDAKQCEFDWKNPRSGKSIAVYFGFDENKKKVCTDAGNGETLTQTPCGDNHCDDGEYCTVDYCDANTGECSYIEVGCLCDNGPGYCDFHDDACKCNGEVALFDFEVKDITIVGFVAFVVPLLVFSVMAILCFWWKRRMNQNKKFKYQSVEQEQVDPVDEEREIIQYQ